jgi:hypothetical protein
MPSSAKTSSSVPSRTWSPTSHNTRSISDRDPDAKLAARREHSRPVFDELVEWAEIHQPFERKAPT